MNHTMDKSQEKNNSFALYFLFKEAILLNKQNLTEAIQSVSKKKVEVNPITGLGGKKSELFVRVVVEGEVFELIGMPTPLPQNIIDYTIGYAYGSQEELQKMAKHKYHILVFYRGNSKDRMTIFDAYKKLAYGFLNQGLLGIANPYSWNVIGVKSIKGMFEDEEMKAFCETPAMMIWRNFIKIPYNDGVWFVTKGNNLFDVTEYAYFGKMEEAQEVYDIFENIFEYIYETKTLIKEGDTMQLGEDTYLRFNKVYELEESLQGENKDTLVIEKITASDIE